MPSVKSTFGYLKMQMSISIVSTRSFTPTTENELAKPSNSLFLAARITILNTGPFHLTDRFVGFGPKGVLTTELIVIRPGSMA